MPDVNVALLRETLEFITANQDQWNQDVWAYREDVNDPSCGTAYCLAGHVVVRAGLTIAWPGSPTRWGDELACDVADGRPISVAALDLLGIEPDGDDAAYHRLLRGDNTLDELWDIASELTDGKIVRPATV